MAKRPTAAQKDDEEAMRLDVSIDIESHTAKFYILGDSPLVMNRMSEKVRQGFLLPAPPKNRAERASVLKHDPIAEFRSSVYQSRRERRATHLHMPAESFKSAISDVAVDIPGAFKAQIGRLVQVPGGIVDLYGVPFLHMAIVRQAGIQKVPDMRTRAIFPQWACSIEVEYIHPLVNARTVLKLLAAAGKIIGIGDGRPQKGKLTFGRFIVVDEGDERWESIVAHQGRQQQIDALASPSTYDDEAGDLLSWFEQECTERSKKPEKSESRPRRRTPELEPA